MLFRSQGKEVVLTEPALRNISIAVAAVLLVPVVAAMMILPNIEKQKKAKLDGVKNEITAIEKKIKSLTDQAPTSAAFDPAKEIEIVLKANRVKLIAYSALGESVPRNLWVTYFSATPDGKLYIKGVCDDVEGIYKFFKNMKDYMVDSQLRLHKLEMINHSLDSAVSAIGGYQFELTNMTDAELNPAPVAENTEASSDGKGKKVNDLKPVKGK